MRTKCILLKLIFFENTVSLFTITVVKVYALVCLVNTF